MKWIWIFFMAAYSVIVVVAWCRRNYIVCIETLAMMGILVWWIVKNPQFWS